MSDVFEWVDAKHLMMYRIRKEGSFLPMPTHYTRDGLPMNVILDAKGNYRIIVTQVVRKDRK